jgi:hypothetical protein
VTDADGATPDDLTIPNSERLLRRVHRTQIVWDENRECARPSSGAFDDDADGISVFLGSTVVEVLHLAEADVLIDWPDFSLAAFPARLPRDTAIVEPPLGIVRDPSPADAAPHPCGGAHALLTGVASGKPGLKRQKRRIAESVELSWAVLRASHVPRGRPD